MDGKIGITLNAIERDGVLTFEQQSPRNSRIFTERNRNSAPDATAIGPHSSEIFGEWFDATVKIYCLFA